MFLLNKIHSFGNKYEVWEGKTLVGVVSNTEGNEYTGGLILNLLECGYEVVKAKEEAKRGNVPIFGLDDLPEGIVKTAFDSFKAVMKNKSGKSSSEDTKTTEKFKPNLFPGHKRNDPLCPAKHIFGCTSCGYSSECSESSKLKSKSKSEGEKLAESLSESLGIKVSFVSGDSELQSMLDLLGVVSPSLINELSELPEPCYNGKVHPNCFICPVSEGCSKFKKELLDSIRQKRNIKGKCDGCGNCKLLNGNCEICPNGEFKLIATKEAYDRFNAKTAESKKKSPELKKFLDISEVVEPENFTKGGLARLQKFLDLASIMSGDELRVMIELLDTVPEIMYHISSVVQSKKYPGVAEGVCGSPDKSKKQELKSAVSDMKSSSKSNIEDSPIKIHPAAIKRLEELNELELRGSMNSGNSESKDEPDLPPGGITPVDEFETCQCGSGEPVSNCGCGLNKSHQELAEEFFADTELCSCGSGETIADCDCSF